MRIGSGPGRKDEGISSRVMFESLEYRVEKSLRFLVLGSGIVVVVLVTEIEAFFILNKTAFDCKLGKEKRKI